MLLYNQVKGKQMLKEDNKMAKELFRFKSDRDLESVKRGLQNETGEQDFLGFEEYTERYDSEQEYFIQMLKEGSIQFDGEYVIINEL